MANPNPDYRLSAGEIQELKQQFKSFDQNGDGSIDAAELCQCLKNLGEKSDLNTVSGLIAEVDQDDSGTIDFNEFCAIVTKMRSGKAANSAFGKVVEKQKMLVVKGAVGSHSFAQEEMTAFAEHLNYSLQGDQDLAHLLPIDSTGTDLCNKVRDGLLLSKFINLAVKDTIDERALNLKKAKDISLFQINENQNLMISAAKSIGVQVVNVGSTELIDGDKNPHLVLGIVWQLVKIQLTNTINLTNHPELYRLLEEGETLQDLLRLPPDQLLLRWFNFHLRAAGHNKKVTNFSGDVKDSEAYTILLNQLAPGRCNRDALNTQDMNQRAELVLQNARNLDVNAFIKASDIVKGNQRLNLAFTACIFNTYPGLEPLTEEESRDLAGMMTDDFGDSREERAFRMWINSLGIQDLYVNSLFEDLKDGLVLLKVIDYIEPGTVAWNRVEMNVNNKFKKVSNCNYAVVLGKQLKFSLVGIGGSDIVDGNRTLILAFVWQLMRHHTIKFLSEVKVGGKAVTEADVVQWANAQVQKAGKNSQMSSFKDQSLCDSLFFFDLLYGINKNIINWDLVTPGQSEEDRLLNARYAISVARKLGCTIFLLPEDIVEVKPKMIFTFVASIMSNSQH